MKLLLRYAHRYLGYTAGVIIAITCLSGAILALEKEITPYLTPSLQAVDIPTSTTPLAPGKLLESIAAQLPEKQVGGLTIRKNPARSWLVEIPGQKEVLFVNPYTAEILGKGSARHPFFVATLKLHRYLLQGEAGRVVVGTATVILIIILLTGAMVWLPSLTKNSRNYFLAVKRKAHAAKRPNRYRKLYDWHVLLALAALPILLLCSITGPAWSFKWYRAGLFASVGTKVLPRQPYANTGIQAIAPRCFHLVDSAIASIQHTNNLQSIAIRMDKQGNALTLATLPNGSLTQKQVDTYTYSIDQQKIVKADLWRDKSRSAKMPTWLYAVHTGTWGGVPTQLLYAAATLLGATLPISGFLMLTARKRRLKKPSAMRS